VEAPLPAQLTCGVGAPAFPPQALDGPGTAQTGDDAASAALRRQIVESSRLPPTGWHRVAESASGVLFVAPGDAETPWLQVSFRLDPTRGPAIDTVGRCDLRPLPPTGATLADWWLDPAAPAPRPGDVAIAALIEEVACAGGDTPAGRVLAPTIRYERDRIVITVAIRTLPGTQSCIGNAPFPVVIDLVEPIGDRLLLDGGVFPPRDARLPQD
jgi:hypothetical protein